MTTLRERVARKVLIKTAALEIKKEIEQGNLEKLKELADLDISIIGVYLKSRSTQQKARIKRDFNVLLQLGVTPDMVLTEVARQMPELAPIMEGKEGYKKGEIENLEAFVKGGQEIKK